MKPVTRANFGRLACAILVTMLIGAGTPSGAHAFRAGVYSDDPGDSTQVCEAAGSTFDQVVWVWVPADLGLVYVTLRFEFPANLGRHSDPRFHDQLIQVIYTDYPDGTVEWNMVLDACPSGWIRIFSQTLELLDGEPSKIGINGADSWIRDCDFVLHRVDVTNELAINDPDCAGVSLVGPSWGMIKTRFERTEQ